MQCLVTGANRGIGLELTKQLLVRGDHVIAVCRNASDELKQTKAELLEGIDVSVALSAMRLDQRLGDRKIDILVNNAGVMGRDSIETLRKDLSFFDAQFQMEANTFGPLRVTLALRDRLHKGSKVAMITSRMGSIGDNTSGGSYGYRMSKAALNMASVSLAHDLKPDGIAVAIIHPGFVRTGMTGGQGHIDADVAAKAILERIDGLTLESSGTFWHSDGSELPW